MTYQSVHKMGLFAIVMTSALALVGCGDDGGGDEGGADGTGMASDTGMDDTGDGGSDGMMGGISHAAEIQSIWTANCVDACHEAGGSAAYLDLSDGMAYANIVGQASPTVPSLTLVEPGDPEASYLYMKVAGRHTELDGGVGLQMPLSDDLSTPQPLPQEEQDLIRDWIAEGAAM